MIVINFKTYPETFGENATKLAKIIKKISQKSGVKIIIAASALDAFRLKQYGLDVWLQHIDEYDPGKHTGWISAKQAMGLGINASLINHFEHQIPKGTALKIIKNKPTTFKIICCAKSIGQIETWIAKSRPDYIFYEDPEFIGSSTDSVASKPDNIKKAVMACCGIPLIVGAGIKSCHDVDVSLNMGAKAVGLASAFVLNSHPQKFLEEIVIPFGV